MAPQLSSARTLVVTNCTMRKRAQKEPVSLPRIRSNAPLSEVVDRWVATLSKAQKVATAGDLYLGRAFSEAKTVAQTLTADLYVVSAGLGLVNQATLVPNYNATIATGPSPLKQALADASASAPAWWRELSRRTGSPRPLSTLIEAQKGQLVLLALPSAYLCMVHDDLAHIDSDVAKSLRIFTSEAGQLALPGRLVPCAMPYDERLETVVGFDGTRPDFPQRAMRHFVEVLAGHKLSLSKGSTAVAEALSGLKFKVLPLREKKTDDEIISLIHRQWDAYSGSSTKLHRYLRDEALVKCEQGRFRLLCNRVREEKILQGKAKHAR
jgi:hypothetical protein